MSKARDHVVNDLRERLGLQVDPAQVVDMLMDEGTIDDSLCRRYAVRRAFARRYCLSNRSAREIQGDIAEEMGLTRQRVNQLVRGK